MNAKISIVPCVACRKEVSEHAEQCPHCGQPLSFAAGVAGKRPLKAAEKFGIIATGLTVGGVLWYLAATGAFQQ